MRLTVTDCPAHASAALRFPAGVLCLACGLEVLDTIDGLATAPAPETLLEQARAAHRANQGVRDFTASCRELASPGNG